MAGISKKTVEEEICCCKAVEYKYIRRHAQTTCTMDAQIPMSLPDFLEMKMSIDGISLVSKHHAINLILVENFVQMYYI